MVESFSDVRSEQALQHRPREHCYEMVLTVSLCLFTSTEIKEYRNENRSSTKIRQTCDFIQHSRGMPHIPDFPQRDPVFRDPDIV